MRRTTRIVTTILALLSGMAAYAQSEFPYGVVQVEENLMIPMRDGVRLATDIYRPSRVGAPVDEKLPVLLQRTPYDKTGTRIVEAAKFFAQNGYVVILQDHRGRYASEGEFTKYIGEGQDGYDTIEWIARQPWCDGNVAMFGPSYWGATQWLAAANADPGPPPHLKAIIPSVINPDFWKRTYRAHGAMNLSMTAISRALHSDKATFENYMYLLKDSFSVANLQGLMCINQLSVDWQGFVYDCDFNQMLNLNIRHPKNQRKLHISDMLKTSLEKIPVLIADHCYGCTAGQGSSCGGALA